MISPEQFSVLIVMLTVVASCLVPFYTFRERMRLRWLFSVAVFILTVISISVASASFQGQNFLVNVAGRLAEFNRVYSVALLAGISIGLVVSKGLASVANNSAFSSTLFAYCGFVLLSNLIIAKDLISPYVRPQLSETITLSVNAEVKVELLGNLSFLPTGIDATPEGTLYVTGLSGIAHQNGVVFRIEVTQGNNVQETLVANYLNIPHGIVVHDDDLYISRAGQVTVAQNGTISRSNTGFVTRLSDLDGDGKFDYYHDVVTGLPGRGLPDGLHQNNGIVFGPGGFLYVTVGAPSDHGPSDHPYSGSILKVSIPDGAVEVFAEGFRNPYGITFGPREQLFCTDNDSSTDAGDPIFHVRKDGHHGHPYSSLPGQVEIEGAVEPLLRLPSAQGIVSGGAGDEEMYVASYTDDSIYRITLKSAGDTFNATSEKIAAVPQPVDLAWSPEGDLFVVSVEKNQLYRISFPKIQPSDE